MIKIIQSGFDKEGKKEISLSWGVFWSKNISAIFLQ